MPKIAEPKRKKIVTGENGENGAGK